MLEDKLNDDEIRELWAENFPKWLTDFKVEYVVSDFLSD